MWAARRQLPGLLLLHGRGLARRPASARLPAPACQRPRLPRCQLTSRRPLPAPRRADPFDVPRSIAPSVQDINALLENMHSRAYSLVERGVSDEALGLLRRMLEPDPAQRVTVEVRRRLRGLVAGAGRRGDAGLRAMACDGPPLLPAPRTTPPPTHPPTQSPPLQEILQQPWFTAALPEGCLALNKAFLELEQEEHPREQSLAEIQRAVEAACGKWSQGLHLGHPPAHPPAHPLPLHQQPGGAL